MKKITHSVFLISLIVFVYSCAGYEAIYKKNIKFEIAEYSLAGDKNLANRIYFKLKNLSKAKQSESDAKSIDLLIKVVKTKNSTVKNTAGKILEYKINLNSLIVVKDFLTEKEILNKNFSYSTSYKVQDQNFETIQLENKSLDNLIDITYQDLLIELSQTL